MGLKDAVSRLTWMVNEEIRLKCLKTWQDTVLDNLFSFAGVKDKTLFMHFCKDQALLLLCCMSPC